MSLTAAEAAVYRDEGYLTGIRVVDAQDAARVREEFDALEAVEGRERCQIGLLDRHFDRPFIWELATRPALLDVVESLMGPDLLLLATHFFCKYGPSEGWVAWHQDVTYWALDPPDAVTAWYAVDASDIGNGCMRVLPKTHRDGIRSHGSAGAEGNLLSINQEVPVTAEEEGSAVDLILDAGQISIHHGALIHGSLPNRSHRRRCGLTLRYVAPDVRPVGINSQGRGWSPVCVRGHDRFGHFALRPAPFEEGPR